jgi:hypothetical protein
MTTSTTHTLQHAVLTPAQCQELIDRYRTINVDDEWWDWTYDQFRDDMTAIGVRVDMMYFSGFSQQGDGACFDAIVVDWDRFLRSLGHTYPILLRHAERYFSLSVSHQGRYCHEHSVAFDIDLPLPGDTTDDMFIYTWSPYPEGDFRSQTWFAVMETYRHCGLHDQCKEHLRDYMRELYCRLEQEYDHLTSDAVVWDTIVANDLDVLDTDDTDDTDDTEEAV